MNAPIAEAAEAYEKLRPHLLELADQNGLHEREILLRRGMLAWASECRQLTASGTNLLSYSIPPGTVRPPEIGEFASELVRLLANLVLSSPKEPDYAGTESQQLSSGA